MDTIEEPQLFGASADWVASVTLCVSLNPKSWHVVSLTGRVHNRRDPMSLVVVVANDQHVSSVVGHFLPICVRAQHVSPSLLRRTFWALNNRLCEEGWDCAIKACGQQPR